MADLTPTTTISEGDELTITVKIADVKPSDHGWFGLHDLMTAVLVDTDGDLPEGLEFHIRRPQDGTADLRSDDRKQREHERLIARQEKAAARAAKQREREQAKERARKEKEAAADTTPLPSAADLDGMTIKQMRVLADKHDITIPRSAKRAEVLATVRSALPATTA